MLIIFIHGIKRMMIARCPHNPTFIFSKSEKQATKNKIKVIIMPPDMLTANLQTHNFKRNMMMVLKYNFSTISLYLV
jgi:hypothetical protein